MTHLVAYVVGLLAGLCLRSAWLTFAGPRQPVPAPPAPLTFTASRTVTLDPLCPDCGAHHELHVDGCEWVKVGACHVGTA